MTFNTSQSAFVQYWNMDQPPITTTIPEFCNLQGEKTVQIVVDYFIAMLKACLMANISAFQTAKIQQPTILFLTNSVHMVGDDSVDPRSEALKTTQQQPTMRESVV